MAYTTINKSTDYFEGKTYLGSSSAVTVSGLSFQPDWVWIKDRDNGNNHCLVDAVRGVGKYVQSDNNTAEINNSSQSISAITSDGFTTGTANPANESASTTKGFISWNWKGANGTASNSDGTITSTVSANTTAGFSIVKFTTPSSGTSTVGHGLGAVPKVWLQKQLDGTDNWQMYHHSIGNTKKLMLNSTGAEGTSAIWQDTTPTSSLMYLGTAGSTVVASSDYIAYCFAEIPGYSKFGSFLGNGNTDGAFIYTGFKPAFFLMKEVTDSSTNWLMYDNKRSTFNPVDEVLYPNLNNSEGTGLDFDFLSNGLKCRTNNGGVNGNSNNYIYMCFASAPLVGTNNIPCTAR
jgi:hypothetical protein